MKKKWIFSRERVEAGRQGHAFFHSACTILSQARRAESCAWPPANVTEAIPGQIAAEARSECGFQENSLRQFRDRPIPDPPFRIEGLATERRLRIPGRTRTFRSGRREAGAPDVGCFLPSKGAPITGTPLPSVDHGAFLGGNFKSVTENLPEFRYVLEHVQNPMHSNRSPESFYRVPDMTRTRGTVAA